MKLHCQKIVFRTEWEYKHRQVKVRKNNPLSGTRKKNRREQGTGKRARNIPEQKKTQTDDASRDENRNAKRKP